MDVGDLFEPPFQHFGVGSSVHFKTWPREDGLDLTAVRALHSAVCKTPQVLPPTLQKPKPKPKSKPKAKAKVKPKPNRKNRKKSESESDSDSEATEEDEPIRLLDRPKACKKKAEKDRPPTLELGRVVSYLPSSMPQLVVRVGQNSKGQDLVWTIDLGDGHPEAEAPNKFCSIPYRYFLRFASSGLTYHPQPSTAPNQWKWFYVQDERLEPKPFAPESCVILTKAYVKQKLKCAAKSHEEIGKHEPDPDPDTPSWSVYVPHERFSVNLLSNYGLFAVNEANLNEPFFKYRVIVE